MIKQFIILLLVVCVSTYILKGDEYLIVPDDLYTWPYRFNIVMTIKDWEIEKRLSSYLMSQGDLYFYKQNNFSKIYKDKFSGVVISENFGYNFDRSFGPITISKEKYFVFKNNGTKTIEFNYILEHGTWSPFYIIIILGAFACLAILFVTVIFILALCSCISNKLKIKGGLKKPEENYL